MKEIISKMLQTGLLVSLLTIAQFAQTARPDQPGQASPPVAIDFRDIASEAGLTAENVSGDADNKRYILETTGDGVAIFDLDNDGLMDVLLVNATTMDGKGRGENSTSHLYRNVGNMHFVDSRRKPAWERWDGDKALASAITTTMATRTCSSPITVTACFITTKAMGHSKTSRKRRD